MRFIQAKNYTKGGNVPRLIVLHSTEGHEREGQALQVANWFANKAAPKFPAPQASAHYVVDNKEVIQCVQHADKAWHAREANPISIGIEIVGKHSQTAAEWNDVYSIDALENVSELLARLSVELSIPLRFVDADGILKGQRGVTTHAECTKAYKVRGGHTDPGPNFPMSYVLDSAIAIKEEEPSTKRLSNPDSMRAIEIDQTLLFPASHPFMPTPRPGVVVVDKLGRRFAVSPCYYGPMGIGEAKRFAEYHGFSLPDPVLVDAIWAAADLKIDPKPQAFKVYDAKNMDSEAAHLKQKQYLLFHQNDFMLQAGGWKDVIEKDSRLGLYGWHQISTNKPVQPAFFRHSPEWRDYSQGVRLVKRLP